MRGEYRGERGGPIGSRIRMSIPISDKLGVERPVYGDLERIEAGELGRRVGERDVGELGSIFIRGEYRGERGGPIGSRILISMLGSVGVKRPVDGELERVEEGEGDRKRLPKKVTINLFYVFIYMYIMIN